MRGVRSAGVRGRSPLPSPSAPPQLCGPSAHGKSQVALTAAVACVLGAVGDTALYIATSTEAFALRAHALLLATVQRRVREAQGGSPDDRRFLTVALPRAALACAASLSAAAAAAMEPDDSVSGAHAVEAALLANVDGAVATEVDAAASCLRFVTALDWPSLQRVLTTLEAALPGPHPATLGGGGGSSGGGGGGGGGSSLEAFAARLRVIVLDSVASIVVPLMGPQPMGHAAMMEVGARLHRMARRRGIAAVVTNSSAMERGDAEHGPAGSSAGGLPLRPSLGPSWLCVPDVSLLVTKQLQLHAGSAAGGGEWGEALSCAVFKAARPHLGPAVIVGGSGGCGGSSSGDPMPLHVVA